MTSTFVVMFIVVITFLFCDSSLTLNLTQAGMEELKGRLGNPEDPYFHWILLALIRGGLLLPS